MSSWWRDSFIEAVSGAAAGASTRTAMAPLDRLKLVVQLQGSIQNDKGKASYRGPWMALKTIIQQEGFLALWRGNVPTILIQGGTSALNFVFMDAYKKVAQMLVEGHDSSTMCVPLQQQQQQQQYTRLGKSLVSGGLAGATAITFLYPIGVMRTKLALDMGAIERQYPRGMRDVLIKSMGTNGVRGLYQGYGVALASVSLYRMVHLGGYDFFKSELLVRRGLPPDGPASSILPLLERFVLAQLVSMLASTAHYPLDSVRRRLMMQSDEKAGSKLYNSAWHCMQTIYRTEGIRGFYLGLGTNYIRSVGGALLLVSYDYFKDLLSVNVFR